MPYRIQRNISREQRVEQREQPLIIKVPGWTLAIHLDSQATPRANSPFLLVVLIWQLQSQHLSTDYWQGCFGTIDAYGCFGGRMSNTLGGTSKI